MLCVNINLSFGQIRLSRYPFPIFGLLFLAYALSVGLLLLLDKVVGPIAPEEPIHQYHHHAIYSTPRDLQRPGGIPRNKHLRYSTKLRVVQCVR